MNWLRKIRVAAAIVLFGTIFLPLSQCSRHDEPEKPPSAKALAHSHHFFPRSDSDFDYQYGIKALGFDLRGALTLIAFAWPLLLLRWSNKAYRYRFWWIFALIELLLCAGTIYWLGVLTFGGRWLYGAYAGEIAIGVYGLTCLILIVEKFRMRARVPLESPTS